jgi:phosphatidylethanolamine/phosphatidyl-N-methylethanolamine N-methyltransferase
MPDFDHPPARSKISRLIFAKDDPIANFIPAAVYNAPLKQEIMAKPSSESVVRTYRRYAPLYDKLFGAVLEPGRIALATAVTRAAPASILEVGVGTGLLLPRYPEPARVVGIDISTEMLAVARKRVSTLNGRNITLMQSDAEIIKLPDRSFDCVTVPYVLSVTPNPQQLVHEIRRVCKKDGTILILNHFSGSRFWWCLERAVRTVADKVGFRSDFDYNEQILRHAWQVEAVQSVNAFGLSKLVTIRNV